MSDEKDRLQRALQALPSFLIMKDRRDHFVFERDGTAHLTWTFEIDSDDKTTDVLFPVFAERTEAQGIAKSAVSVKELWIDGKRKTALADIYQPEETRTKLKPPLHRMEFGSLHLRLPPKTQRCSVVLKLTFEGSFPNLDTSEFVYVDIPILTERVKVILEGPQGMRLSFPSVRDDALIATLGMVDLPDPGETLRQRQQWQETEDGKIEWETEYPKLGYRYKLLFCLAKA